MTDDTTEPTSGGEPSRTDDDRERSRAERGRAGESRRDGRQRTRRDVLATTAGLVATAGVASQTALASRASVVGSRGNDGERPPHPHERFRVEGRQAQQTKVRRDHVDVKLVKSAPALKRRYGIDRGTIQRRITFDRPEPEADDLPERRTLTRNDDWSAPIAKPGEWREAFRRDAASRDTAPAVVPDDPSAGGVVVPDGESPRRETAIDVTAASDGLARESDYAFGVYEYEQIDGLFERTAPMNVISDEPMADVVGTLTSNGYTGYVIQYDRYGYDSSREAFRTQDDSAATGTFGFLGRKHAKFWEFGGHTSCSAHVDDAVPHDAVSHEDAEEHVEGVFDDASGWSGYDDYYALENGSYLDHDGSATALFR
ncbi:hypothetical protein RYH80_05575 [Halobaculum sp. MBLA0147]|uniref:hypothetical protein n=1 Tax=Halobaculum sp. MBLA0147 TaxID=3079934 RepID=UPI00352601E0